METMTTILAVDDDLFSRSAVKEILGREGFQVLTAADGVEALDLLRSQSVDLILADIMMPRMNGYQLHEQVIQNPQWVTIPFLFLTARALDSDIRYGKELGADAYLTKPIEPHDLVATVRGRLRRAQLLAQSQVQAKPSSSERFDLLVLGQLQIDCDQHRVWLDRKRIKLSRKEFRLLKCLAQRANKVVPLHELIQATHGLETDRVESGSLLRPLVRSLRRKLGYPAGDMGCIENVRGVGYQLIPPVSDRDL